MDETMNCQETEQLILDAFRRHKAFGGGAGISRRKSTVPAVRLARNSRRPSQSWISVCSDASSRPPWTLTSETS